MAMLSLARGSWLRRLEDINTINQPQYVPPEKYRIDQPPPSSMISRPLYGNVALQQLDDDLPFRQLVQEVLHRATLMSAISRPTTEPVIQLQRRMSQEKSTSLWSEQNASEYSQPNRNDEMPAHMISKRGNVDETMCGLVCHPCETLMSKRWSALCSVQCSRRQGGSAWDACLTLVTLLAGEGDP